MEQGEAVTRQHMQLRAMLQQQQEQSQQQQQQQEKENEEEEDDDEPHAPTTRRARLMRQAGYGQQPAANATPGVSNIFSAMSIDTPQGLAHLQPPGMTHQGGGGRRGAGMTDQAGADGDDGDADEDGTPVPLFPTLGGVPSSAGSSGGGRGRGLFGDSGGSGADTAHGGGGPGFAFQAGAGGAGGAAAGGQVTPHMLSFVTPSPGGGLEGPPGVPFKGPGGGGGGATGTGERRLGTVEGRSTACVARCLSCVLRSTQTPALHIPLDPTAPGAFPGFNTASTAGTRTGADRTPVMAARARGGAVQKAGRAAGRLFPTTDRERDRSDPGSTLRWV